MMELLPAGSWSDLATNQRLDQVSAEIRAEMAELRTELIGEMARFQAEIRSEMARFQAEIRSEMGDFRAEIRSDMSGFRIELAEIRAEIHRSARNAMAVNTAAMIAIGGMLVAALRI